MRLMRNVLAMESRFFDSLLAGDASAGLKDSEVDVQKLHALERQPALIDALDAWIRMPDKNLYPRLTELAALVLETYELPHSIAIFRGFDPQSPYQNTMGLAQKGLMFNTVKPHAVGETHHYEDSKPISFTTDENIARAFGKVVIRMEVNPRTQPALVITPELCALVCKRRNVEPQTQKEVILLPPVCIDYVIHAIKP
jgi:hypothetical protein